MIIDKGVQIEAVEIKSGKTFNPTYFKGLRNFQQISGTLPSNSYVVYGGEETQKRSIALVVGWKDLATIVKI